MTTFENVAVVKVANVYFEERVTSRTLLSSSKVKVLVKTLTDYCCSFIA